uniref:Uncharacterized protein n=1 Tax=Rhizophora mucronata TaxID=61149 RepID=A0A2P2QNJ3_RHIMU
MAVCLVCCFLEPGKADLMHTQETPGKSNRESNEHGESSPSLTNNGECQMGDGKKGT